ncbi:VanZ family protein [Loktanella salsilacus]|jgi:glycopeptide antibiotics resistance protein|uniref:VanZ family protein n=1 Tax=Loktanella salsilacus TaxID=195913 RepID=UPI0037040149
MVWLVQFAGFALLYGAVGSLAFLAILRLFGKGDWRLLPLFFTTLTFVALTQHPFPDPTTMVCPIKSAAPQLVPFKFSETFLRLHNNHAPALKWFMNRTLVATAMNFLLCAVIGMALAPHVVTWRSMLAFAFGLTLLVELTQLTGAWGLYPCAWRQFNVDDLMMNALGVIFGWSWINRMRRES